MTSRAACFFDLDRTLLDVNSARLFVRREYSAGRLTRGQFLRSGIYFVLYHLSMVDVESAVQQAAAQYVGQPVEDLRQQLEEWFATDLVGRLRPGAADAIETHRQRGEQLVVLTGSSDFVARAAAVTWRLDAGIGNIFEVDETGHLTGRFETPVTCGPGKTLRAERWAAEAGVDLSASTFYTDSYTDRDLLERVGQPRVVAPDPRLRHLARRQGWPIEDW